MYHMRSMLKRSRDCTHCVARQKMCNKGITYHSNKDEEQKNGYQIEASSSAAQLKRQVRQIVDAQDVPGAIADAAVCAWQEAHLGD